MLKMMGYRLGSSLRDPIYLLTFWGRTGFDLTYQINIDRLLGPSFEELMNTLQLRQNCA